MISSKELRSGNYVQGSVISIPRLGISSDGIMQITAYGISCLEENPALKLEPIPLSPEILEKCGFVKRDNIFVFQPELENIEYRVVDFHGWIFSKGFGDWNDEITLIQHLHQLQNIFFAVQREELNYTP